MTVQITLLTPLATLEAMHRLTEGRKAQIRVDREALSKLLVDHHAMFHALNRSSTFTVKEPAPKRERLRLGT